MGLGSWPPICRKQSNQPIELIGGCFFFFIEQPSTWENYTIRLGKEAVNRQSSRIL